MKKVILLYFLFSFIISYSQRIDLPGEYIRQRVVGKNIPSNVVGSQFYNEAFAIGTIYKNDSKEFSALLRYDAFNDEIQIKQNDDITSLLKVDNISVSLNNKKYKVFNYKIESNTEQGFFICLTEKEDIQLLLQEKKRFVEATKAANSYAIDKPPTFKDDNNYYIYINNKLNIVNLKKNDILNILNDKKEELDNYISKNKLKLKSESDFIELIKFYNTLK